MSELDIHNVAFLEFGPFSLTIAPGECVGLSGASGAGKTLLLRAIADLDPHTGNVRLDGVDAHERPAPEWRRNVGMLPAESHWWANTVGDHFSSADRFGEFGFDPSVLQWEIARLSTGERHRLAFLRLLANRPAVLLLDEPTANLDAKNASILEAMVAAYREENEAAVLWVAHDAEQLDRVASRSLIIRDGRLHE